MPLTIIRPWSRPRPRQMSKFERTRPWAAKLLRMSRINKKRRRIPLRVKKMPIKTLRKTLAKKINVSILRDIAEKKRTRGFRVSRFILRTIPLAVDTDTAFNNAGLMPLLSTTITPYLYNGSVAPATTVLYNPGNITSLELFCCYPQWPGSTCGLRQRVQGVSNLSQPRFGMIPANSVNPNNNYQWNTRAVDEVYPLYQSTKLVKDNLDLIFRRLIVYKTHLTFTLTNINKYQGIDVHIVHFKVKSYSVQIADGTCQTQSNIQDMVSLFINGKTSAQDKTLCTDNWKQCVDRKKLPSTNFITIGWRKITLGRPTSYGDMSPNLVREPPATKRVSFHYGMKDFKRVGCQEEGVLFTDEVLGATIFNEKVTMCMVFHCITDQNCFNTIIGDVSSNLMMKVEKVNIWREYN